MIKTGIGVTVAGTLECLDKNMYSQTANHLKETILEGCIRIKHYIKVLSALSRSLQRMTKLSQQSSH